MRKYFKYHLGAAALFYLLSFLIFLAIDSPYPYLASLAIAFFAFEISVYYFFQKDKKTNNSSL